MDNHSFSTRRSPHGMVCQLCRVKAATYQITERSSTDRFGEAHYCFKCYEAKYLKPPPPGGFPRPRSTIKNVMMLVAVWAVPNAITAWIMRSGHFTGSPAQVRRWTLYAFLGVNLVLGFLVVYHALLTWLTRVLWFRRTGGVVPMPAQEMTPGQQRAFLARLVPLCIWIVVAVPLTGWLTPRIWPIQSFSTGLLFLIMFAPFLPGMVLALAKNQGFPDWVRQDWRTAAGPERIVRALAMVWGVGFFLTIVMGGPSLMRWGFVPWFPIPTVVLIGMVGQLVLLAAVSLSVRRR